jgi:hypothetical protein
MEGAGGGMSETDTITRTMTLHREDGQGLRVSLDGDERTAVVLPKSQVRVEPGPGRSVRVTMPTSARGACFDLYSSRGPCGLFCRRPHRHGDLLRAELFRE